ncbi:MAG: VCBS repeat-containing protein, partial [Phycisphaerales bacterium]
MEDTQLHKSRNGHFGMGKTFGRAQSGALVPMLLLVVTVCSVAVGGDVAWTRKSTVTGEMPTPNGGKQQTCCVICDIDKDGIDDFVVGERTKTPSVVWYKFTGRRWEKYIVDNTRKNPEAGGDFCDIDRDGDFDIILGQDASG